MSSIVYTTNKSNGHVYAYRAWAYRDPLTGKPKSRRTYLGRVDSETHEFLDPEVAAREAAVDAAEAAKKEEKNSTRENAEIMQELVTLRAEVSDLRKEIKKRDTAFRTICDALNKISDV